ncbi:hypothetical protein E2C01_007442 [Portunus trituberculatus]|uniref:Uncharacterized protein n=1 Tax=Portunus trituberculatus TaxID=210409 RepID=A0A5B7D0I3_PORTR|nr:hypothetical protein [Portunus trituberculatus]
MREAMISRYPQDLPRPSNLTRPYDPFTKAPTHALPFLKRHATTLVLNRQNRPQGPHLDSTTLSKSAPHLALSVLKYVSSCRHPRPHSPPHVLKPSSRSCELRIQHSRF